MVAVLVLAGVVAVFGIGILLNARLKRGRWWP
jgi:hypothetical protein